MSVVVSTSRLIPGAIVCGVRGLGTKGSDIPSSGSDGPSPVFPSLSLPADANKEYRVVLVAQPSFGNVQISNNTATLVTSLHDGTTNFSLDVYESGVKIGTIANTVNIGTGIEAVLSGVESSGSEVGDLVVSVPAGVILTGVETGAGETGFVDASTLIIKMATTQLQTQGVFDASSGSLVGFATNGGKEIYTIVPVLIITGIAKVGQTLTAVPGTGWQITGGQWYGAGVAISGATSMTYVVQAGDVSKEITFVGTGVPYKATAGIAVA